MLFFTSSGLTIAFAYAPTPDAGAPRDPDPIAGAPPASSRWSVKLDFVGANPDVVPLGQQQTSATFSYFKGQPSQWQTGLPGYTQIRYANLWPGIDLVYS